MSKQACTRRQMVSICKCTSNYSRASKYQLNYMYKVEHFTPTYSNIVTIVLNGNDAHYVRRVLGVRVLTVLIGQHQTCISLFNLDKRMR